MSRVPSALSGAARSVHPKVAGAGGGSAAAGALAVLLSAVGVHLDAGEIAALGTIAALLAGWLTPAPKAPPPVLAYASAMPPPVSYSGLAASLTAGNVQPYSDHDHPSLRREVAALNERTQQLMLDLTALQADVKALGDTVVAVAAVVQSLEANAASEQATVDQLDADVKAAQQKLAALVPIPPTPAGSSVVSISLSPPTLASDGASTAAVTVTVTDAAGNPLSTENVAITSSDPLQAISGVVPAGNGIYAATITASTTPGTATLTATDGTASATATLTQA